MKSLSVFFIFLLTTVGLFASIRGYLPISEISLKHSEVEVFVRIDPETSNLSALKIVVGKKQVTIPVSEFEGVANVDIYSVRLQTIYGAPGAPPIPPKEYFTIVLDYGPEKLHFDKELNQTIRVRSSASFVIANSELQERLTHIPQGASKNRWEIFSKMPGKGTKRMGLRSQARNPNR